MTSFNNVCDSFVNTLVLSTDGRADKHPASSDCRTDGDTGPRLLLGAAAGVRERARPVHGGRGGRFRGRNRPAVEHWP